MSNVLESILMGLETEPSGLQAAARLAGEQNKKVAELILAAVSAAGHIQILHDRAAQWIRSDSASQCLYEALDARDELLRAVQELSREP